MRLGAAKTRRESAKLPHDQAGNVTETHEHTGEY